MSSSIQTLFDLLDQSDFITGLVIGTVLLCLIFIPRPPRHGYGLAVAIATLVGVQLTIGRRLSTTVGIALVALGGWLLNVSSDEEVPSPIPWIIIGVGAIVATARGDLPDSPWIQISAPIAIVVAGHWLQQWRYLPQARWVGPLFTITAFGIWTTVPETDGARVLLGAALPLSVATVPRLGARMATWDAFPLAAVMIWVAGEGGAERHGSMVGAWACIGALLILPLLGPAAARVPTWLLFACHSAFVLAASRVFGLMETGLAASIWLATTGTFAYLALRWFPYSSTNSPATTCEVF